MDQPRRVGVLHSYYLDNRYFVLGDAYRIKLSGDDHFTTCICKAMTHKDIEFIYVDKNHKIQTYFFNLDNMIIDKTRIYKMIPDESKSGEFLAEY